MFTATDTVMKPHDSVLIDGRLMHYLGSCQTDFSQYPVATFMDITNERCPKVFLELKDYGKISYPLSHISGAYLHNTAVRHAVRRYEDYVIARQQNGQALQPAEVTFYDWILSR